MPGERIALPCARAGEVPEEVVLLSIGKGQKVEEVYELPSCLVVPGDVETGLLPGIVLCAVDALQFEAAPRFCSC